MYTGPKTTNYGLIYGYDTGYGVANNHTNTRFYPGEPTTNYVTDSSILGAGWTGSFSLIDSTTKSFQLNVNSFHTDGAGWRSFMWDMRAHTGSAVTISATIEIPDDSPGDLAWVMMGQANSGGSGTTTATYLGYSASSERYYKTTKNTERISWSGTIGNTGTANQPNGIIGFTVWYNSGTNNTNSFIKVSNVQIEKKSHATPFVNGTRSATAGLIDLKRTKNIDLSNVSFDSTGQLAFDGTDDYISLGDDEDFDFTDGILTVEAVVKFPNSWTSGDQYPNIVSKGGSAGWDTAGWSLFGFRGWPSGSDKSWGFALRNGNSTRVASRNDVAEDVFVHIAATLDTSAIKLYENGVEVASVSQLYKPEANTTSFLIGKGPSNHEFPGDIPVVKVYDRTLTATEIKENFNSLKNRFNI
jgi:hypothetical protein